MMTTYFNWSNNLETAIPEIDNQHKRLVDLVNQLYNAFYEKSAKDKLEPILNELINYTVEHFTFEENYFGQYPTDQFSDHKLQHKDFREKVVDFKKKFDEGSPITFRVMNFLRDWLTKHIQGSDMQYAEIIRSKSNRNI